MILRALCASAVLALSVVSAHAQCRTWSGTFAPAGPDGEVYCQTEFQLGGVSRLIVGGAFGATPGGAARNVAALDGSSWSALGDGLDFPVYALEVFDPGSGAELWAGGASFIARFDGFQWHRTDVVGDIRSFAVHDQGSGAALWAAGNFSSIGGALMQAPARLTNGAWQGVFPPQTGGREIRALASHDDGAGPALYLAGPFTSLAGNAARRLARWDGIALTEVGGGIEAQLGLGVLALQSAVSSTGVPELHVGGYIDGAGGIATSRWIAWSGGAWIDVGGSELVTDFTLARVNGVEVVHAARNSSVERWQGSTRVSLPSQVVYVPVRSIGAFGSGPDQQLVAGVSPLDGDGAGIQLWNGAAFVPAGSGLESAPSSLSVHPFSGRDELVAVGSIPLMGDRHALRFDGSQWSPLPPIPASAVNLRAVHSHDGTLYAAGIEFPAGRPRVWSLTGSTWSPVGPIASGSFFTTALALASYDDGAGPALFVGGEFLALEAAGTQGIAKLTSTGWGTVGGGINTTATPTARRVAALATWDDGAGRALYAGGSFASMGGVPANNIARWDGVAWQALGDGVRLAGGVAEGPVRALATFHDGQTDMLVAGGYFSEAGGSAANSLAAWDGTSWSTFGSGLQLATPTGLARGWCNTLASVDLDGGGQALLVLGLFDFVDGHAARGAALWDGSTWTALDFTGTAGSAAPTFDRAVAVHDDGTGRALYVGGGFSSVAGVASARMARLSDPCGASVGLPRCTGRPNSSGSAARLRATGSSSLAADDFTLSARSVPADRTTLFFMGSAPAYLPFGDGLRCVGGSLRRFAPVLSNSAGEAAFDFDFNAPYASSIAAGTRSYFQAAFRDTVGGATGFNTSDSLEVLFLP